MSKAALCKSNGVTLIYWRFDEAISKNKLAKKIKLFSEKHDN